MFVRRAIFIAVALASSPVSAVQLKDDRGIVTDIRTPPARIVTLSPHLTEIVYAAGAGAKLAAVVRFSDYPPEAARLPEVGDASRIDLERLIALKPDLVLGWRSGNPPDDLERIEKLGFPVFVTEPRRLPDIARLVRAVGTLAGSRAAAETAAAEYERTLSVLRARYAARQPVRVFYEIWHRPLLTVNGDHIISDVIALCGGRNVFADVPVLTPSVSIEAVAAAKPEVVLGGSSAMAPGDLRAEWSRAPVGALRELPVGYVPPDLIQRQTPRIAQGAKVVCEHLDAVRKR